MAGTVLADTLQDGAGNSTTMTNAIQGSAKAWVLFNGVSGSVAIRASYNVSSVTRNSTGNYTTNFTNTLTDANYTLSGSAEGSGSNAVVPMLYASGGANTPLGLKSASQCQIVTTAQGSGALDFAYISFIFHR